MSVKQDFEIATDAGRGNPPGRDTRTGYVIGDYAAHKEKGKGVFFWTFTHCQTFE